MKFIEKNGNITVMGWKLVTIRVSSNDDLSEKRIAEPGVYFLVDEKTCYSEPEDMSRALSAIWQAEEQWAEQQRSEEQQEEHPAQPERPELLERPEQPEHPEQPEQATDDAHKSHHEAICFISDDELSGRKILSVLGYLGFVKLRMKRGPAHAEGHERPDGFVLYKGSVIRESCYSALDFPEAYAKVTWEDNGFGVLEEDFCFRSPSDAARFVSGYKSINGPGNWTDENGNTLSSLRKNCFMTKREHPACKACKACRKS